MKNAPYKFPKDFLWGASTASHQVEGDTYNQWTIWELENASMMAKTAEDRLGWLAIWEEIEGRATQPGNYVSGAGVEHYQRFEEDFILLERLNLNSLRFGIEWARIEPEEGEWDDEAIAHYRDYIGELNRRGIEPVLNLWHWTLPVWFAERGGFAKRANLVAWQKFVLKVADELLDDLNYVITLNEPNVYTGYGYVSGEWPPEYKNPVLAVWTYANLVSAHKQAYHILKTVKPKLQVGMAAQLANIRPKRPDNLIDKAVARAVSFWWNWWFLRRIRKQQDFVGFNHYFTDYYRGIKRDNPKEPLSDLNWYMEPKSIYEVIMAASRKFKKPIIVTENGVADMHDKHRQWWLEETMTAMERAIQDGAELKGYFHWSLLDNFEWKYGWWPKFGLIEVDREHKMKRSIRPSAYWWAKTLQHIRKNK